jgi:hypothetical protein
MARWGKAWNRREGGYVIDWGLDGKVCPGLRSSRIGEAE